MRHESRNVAAEIMRFVRGAQGMTHDQRAWFVSRIEPIIKAALDAERDAWRTICETKTKG